MTSVADRLHLRLHVLGPTRVHRETSSSSAQQLPCPCPSYPLPSAIENLIEDTRIKARSNMTILEQYLEKRSPKQSNDLIEPKHVLLGDDIVSHVIFNEPMQER